MTTTVPIRFSANFLSVGALALRFYFCLIALLLQVAQPAHGAAGDLDSLNADVVGDYVLANAVQPDGKVIIVGGFTSVLGVPRDNIARLNADGTLDSDFDPKTNGEVSCVMVQADGKILLGGTFTTIQPNGAVIPTARNYIARVNSDGTLDTGFDPKPNFTVYSIAVQTDSKILFSGGFTTLQPNGTASTTTRNYIARVNADGTLDAGFDPKASNIVFCVAGGR
jgi:uncharacterized delta-60 repeat protein